MFPVGLTDAVTLGNLHLSGSGNLHLPGSGNLHLSRSAVCNGWDTFGISGAPCGQPQWAASATCGILELLHYQMLVLSSE